MKTAIVLLLLLAVPAFGETVSWDLPTRYVNDNVTVISPAVTATIICDLYEATTATATKTKIATSAPGANSLVTPAVVGRYYWLKACIGGACSDYSASFRYWPVTTPVKVKEIKP
jgi:hypothetical protein